MNKLHIVFAGAGEYALRMGSYSFLFSAHNLKRLLCLSMLITGLAALALMAGDTWLSPAQLLEAFQTPTQHSLSKQLTEFRWPRIGLALLTGAALGIAGCLTQALTRNRLASPELLGINDGAIGAVLLGLLFSPSGMLGPWWVGPLGACLAAGVLLIAAGGMGSCGQRILIIGIGLTALWRALTEFVLSKQDLLHASAIYQWSSGTLATQGHEALWPLCIALAVAMPPTLLNARRLALLHFDPEQVAALGLSIKALQWQALLTALLLAGLSVGLSGPIAFVALAAPIVASQFTRAGHMPLMACALLGAGLVLMADTLGRTLLPNIELPAGIICNVLGGPFLLWLLFNRQGHTS